ncbi:MAG: YfcE family phosphodiesterase [Acutalibacteraceae bacterium]
MDILVVSDSHGIVNNLTRIIEREKECKTVFFLGDGARDIEYCKSRFPDRRFICVKGNNDWGSENEDEAYKYIEGNTIVAVHGHLFGVRYGLYELVSKAESVRANVALYGHTHVAGVDCISGISLINPGAVCDGRYAVITLDSDGPFPKLKSLY